MKVYVVFNGDPYGDAYVDFVTANKKLAQEYCKLYFPDSYYEEYDTNDYTMEQLAKDKTNR